MKNYLFLILSLLWQLNANAQLDELYNSFDSDFDKVKLYYLQELENDNGRNLIEYLDKLYEYADDLLDEYSFKDMPNSFFYKMREYKDLASSLLFFIRCASGENDEASWDFFKTAIWFLGLDYSSIKSIPNCGNVYYVKFGNPSYHLYFIYNENPSRITQFNYVFKGNKKVGTSWMYVDIIKGYFNTASGDIEGFARFREVSTVKDIRLYSITCKPANY